MTGIVVSANGKISKALLISIVVIGCFLIISIGIATIFWMKRGRKRTQDEISLEDPAPLTSGVHSSVSFPSETKSTHFTRSLILEQPHLYINGIVIGKKLGQGKFGDVYLGVWNETTFVALKCLKVSNDFKQFENEMELLMKLNHPNIVRALGIFKEQNESIYLVMEYFSLGCLSDFLRREDIQSKIGLKDLLSMCVHSAAGCSYLEKMNVIHRDLGARNLLVANIDELYVVKISDFGLSREVSDSYYLASDGIFAVKWAAPETIAHRYFSHKSDVWSFAVVLWEIFEYGKLPYISMSNEETAKQVLNGYRLPQPDTCPSEVYNIMMECWNEDPEKRPDFKSIYEKLSAIFLLHSDHSDQSQNTEANQSIIQNPPILYNNSSDCAVISDNQSGNSNH